MFQCICICNISIIIAPCRFFDIMDAENAFLRDQGKSKWENNRFECWFIVLRLRTENLKAWCSVLFLVNRLNSALSQCQNRQDTQATSAQVNAILSFNISQLIQIKSTSYTSIAFKSLELCVCFCFPNSWTKSLSRCPSLQLLPSASNIYSKLLTEGPKSYGACCFLINFRKHVTIEFW